MNNDELLPCPHCGGLMYWAEYIGHKDYIHVWGKHSDDCMYGQWEANFSMPIEKKDKFIAHWNMRAK